MRPSQNLKVMLSLYIALGLTILIPVVWHYVIFYNAYSPINRRIAESLCLAKFPNRSDWNKKHPWRIVRIEKHSFFQAAPTITASLYDDCNGANCELIYRDGNWKITDSLQTTMFCAELPHPTPKTNTPQKSGSH